MSAQPARRLRRAPLVLAFAAAIAIAAPIALARDDSDRVDDLLRTVKRARIIDLSHTWEIDSPVAGVNPTYSFSLVATHANTRDTFGDGGHLSFAAELMLKDAGLALDQARAAKVPTPMLEETQRTYAEAVADGWGKEDFSAVTHVIEKRIGGKVSR